MTNLASPYGSGVAVGDGDGVCVRVGVRVGVKVGVSVGVIVGVIVAVEVGAIKENLLHPEIVKQRMTRSIFFIIAFLLNLFYPLNKI